MVERLRTRPSAARHRALARAGREPRRQRRGTRHNANGVDLNRNFPYRWQPQDGVYESGPGPASEAETQVMQRFIERERPRVTLWYHQALRMVVKSTGDAKLERLYSARSGLPRRSLPRYHGTAISWQNHTFQGDTAFVVELAGGALPSAGVRRHAGAVLALARAVAPPREVAKPIPYGPERRADMADYAQRHYGFHDFRLEQPRVIVQHYTVTSSFPPVFDYFSRNQPDPELNELPGVCAHYVIDRDGTIYRLVSPADHVPPHGRPQLDRDRHRARGPERRPGDGQPAPARGVAAADARAPGPATASRRRT